MWLAWLFNGKPLPASGFNQHDLPDAKLSIWNELTLSWLFPLLKVGYTRPLVEDDLWRMDAARGAAPLGRRIALAFYERCPPEMRPAYLKDQGDAKNNGQVHDEKATADSVGPPPAVVGGDNEKFAAATEREGTVESIADAMAPAETPIQAASAHATHGKSSPPSSWFKQHLRPSLAERMAGETSIMDADGSDNLDRMESRQGDDGLQRVETRARNIKEPDQDVALRDVVDPGERTAKYDQSLFRALMSTFRLRAIICFLAYNLGSALLVGSSFVTKQLISYISESRTYHDASPEERNTLKTPPGIGFGFGMAITLAVMQLLALLSQTTATKIGFDAGLLIRTGLSEMICRKSLSLSARARFVITDGRMTNSLAADTNALVNGPLALVGVISAPLTISGGFVALIVLLGPSALVGLGWVLLLMPCVWWALRRYQQSSQLHLSRADKRLNLTAEVLGNIRGIKAMAYELYFQERIFAFREQELGRLRENVRQKAALKSLLSLSPVLATVLTFVTYAATGYRMDPPTVFAALQLFGIVADPITNLSFDCIEVLNSLVASRRVRDILIGEDLQATVQYSPSAQHALGIGGVFQYDVPSDIAPIPNVASQHSWRQRFARRQTPQGFAMKEDIDSALPDPFRFDIGSLSVRRGEFLCIVGKIGSGKTTLLNAMLGEMRSLSGYIIHGSKLSYVAQHPWVQSGSIRASLLFGSVEDPARMKTAIHSCALDIDLDELAYGLDTEIGERGITLSGGQKARLALARAVYAQREMVIMDDPLSAVDAHVCHRLIHDCILGEMRNCTRILVTHSLDVLPYADRILVVEGGRICQEGTFEQLQGAPGWLHDLLEQHGKRIENARVPTVHQTEGSLSATSSEREDTSRIPAAKLTETEERNTGSVSWAEYGRYFKLMGGSPAIATLAVGIFLQEAGEISTRVILSLWTGTAIPGFHMGHYIAMYGALSMVEVGAVAISVLLFGLAGQKASKRLFATAYSHLMQSGITWYDRTPTGRIQSRLSKDVGEADSNLSYALLGLATRVAGLLGSLGLILWSYALLGVLVVPLVLVFLAIAEFYRRTAREMKRLDSTIRSFTYSAFSEQLKGLVTIRAFEKQSDIAALMCQAIDRQQAAQYLGLVLRRYLSFRLNSIGSVLILGIGFFGVGFRHTVSPSKFGVVLTYTITAVSSLALMIRLWINLEQAMNSVERLSYYGNLPVEEKPGKSVSLPERWPNSGNVRFEAVQLRYREELSLVLKGLSFDIEPGQKVGIVGRTGAGKSTIAQALFRIVNTCGGRIIVDGIDIQDLALRDLRTSLSCIPQDSLLFEGKMRDNLDPTGLHSDAQMHEALGRCGLQPASDASDDDKRRFEKFKLDAEVATDGRNFSAGERQLVALARAVLKGSKVILLDEATSSVDAETDAQFQRTVRKELHGTVITIAHRLISIAFYDKVLVLEDGQAAEYGSPLELFDKPKSTFRSLCDAARLTREEVVQIRAAV